MSDTQAGRAPEPLAAVPLDLDVLRSALASAGSRPDGTPGSLQPLQMSEVSIGPGVLDRLGDVVAALSEGSGEVVVLAAATPITVRGSALREVVESQLASRYALRWVALGPADGSVHADEATVTAARKGAADAG